MKLLFELGFLLFIIINGKNIWQMYRNGSYFAATIFLILCLAWVLWYGLSVLNMSIFEIGVLLFIFINGVNVCRMYYYGSYIAATIFLMMCCAWLWWFGLPMLNV